MLAHPVAAAVLLLGQGSAAVALKSDKPDFLRKMDGHKKHARRRLSVKEFHDELYGDSKKSEELRQKVIEKSTVVKPPGGDRRKLQNYNNNANKQSEYNPYNNGGNYVYDEDGNVQFKYNNNKDGVDDYFQTLGDWENIFGFDPTQFSVSYHRCANVRQFDDQIAAAEDTDTVFATKRFAVFRFCPAATCMGWDGDEQFEDWECDEDTYGQNYCAALDEYMEAMEYNAQTYKQYGGWNGYNGGQMQANNWMDVNQGTYDNSNANGNLYYGARDEDDDGVVGARGKGCQNNYGEYLMELDDYLQLMLEWQEERFEQYCMYCEECMYDVYEMWLKNGGDTYNRKLSFEEFKDSEEHRNLGGNNYYKLCPEYDTCSEYQNTCKHGVVDNYSGYFECTEVESSSGMIAYIGPHCSDDGFTFTLGVYSDPYCNEYIGDGVDIYHFIGEKIDIEEDIFKDYYNGAFGTTLSQLKYVNEENVCIPCGEKDLLWVDREYNNNGYDDDDDYNKATNINDLCQNMYMVTARCDKHYRTYKNRSELLKYKEAVANENLSCDFIDSIVMGNYNEWGILATDSKTQNRWMGNNAYAQQAGQSISEVSPLQTFGLLLSIVVVGVLGMWSYTLHKSMNKAEPWRPRRGLQSSAVGEEPDVTRRNSGIEMDRSASNTSYYMS